MKRSTIFFDRLGVLIIGLALAAVGAGAALWQRDQLPVDIAALDLSSVTDLQQESWWPWALLGVGIVIVLLVLLSLIRRLPAASGRSATLPSTVDLDGTVTVDLRAVTKRAVLAARNIDGVRSARGKLRRERSGKSRIPVITLIVRASEDADLRSVATGVAELRSSVASVVGDDTVGVRVLLGS